MIQTHPITRLLLTSTDEEVESDSDVAFVGGHLADEDEPLGVVEAPARNVGNGRQRHPDDYRLNSEGVNQAKFMQFIE